VAARRFYNKRDLRAENTSGTDAPLTPRQQWQQLVDALNDEIAQVAEDIEAIQNRDFGYGPNRTTGSESYLRQLMAQLADLMTRRPPE
jgi:hypothetical protein